MGMFDKLLGSREISLTPQAGLLLAAITMVSADGDVDDNEVAVIRRLDGSGRTDDWDAAVQTWKRFPLEECARRAAAALNPDQRIATIANLIDIAMADGFLAGAERDLLERYVPLFEIPAETVQSIVEVIAIKNNKGVFTAR